MSDESYLPGRLCYPGKRIELSLDEEITVTVVTRIDGQRVGIRGRLWRDGPCDVMVVFFGERFKATGIMMPAIVGSEVVIESDFVPMNARSAPRVSAVLAGTYYILPPSVGIPMQVLDLSVTGVAIEPISQQLPAPGQRQMISFHLGDREIKTVIEFVAIEDSLWRARFLKLALSDEDAIAKFVMTHQLDRRRSLSDLEIRTPSSLDLETRLEFPLIESISWSSNSCTLRTGSISATVMVPPSLPAARDRIGSLVGVARVGDPRDFAHLLGLVTSDTVVLDSTMAPYLVLSARCKGVNVLELLLSYVEGSEEIVAPSIRPLSPELSPYSVPAHPPFADSNASTLMGYSCGIAVYQSFRGKASALVASPPSEVIKGDGPWIDPLALALLIQRLASVEVRPAWPTLTTSDDGVELFQAFASLAATESS
ncbi:hypothetical protein [Ferrimicrobium sp.]|uniref:hypothetical protein n=1 Tax=Ferrimicrobium sp. TaxID=2926050 RepID=UPI0026076548|nr:hypothetical protein [Ferrimicrobium sp.]